MSNREEAERLAGIEFYYARIMAIEEKLNRLEAVIDAARIVAKGKAIELETTPLRLKFLRKRLKELDGEGK